jgi:glycosyltransferase involved in cell wall biosynthesis
MKHFKEKYDVSVIIPTYNRSELLGYTLNALASQSASKDYFEVIIGDDGSDDDTYQVMEKFQGLLNLKYVYQSDIGYRPGSARNKAIEKAEGYICLFIDCGIILHSTCIAEHILFHSNKNVLRSAVGYVYGYDHDKTSESEIKTLIDLKNPDLSIEKLSAFEEYSDIREKQYRKYNDIIENLPAPWFYFWTCHVSAITSVIKKIGLFDENYDGRWGVEDIDLGFRLNQNGNKIYLLRSAKAIHYPHGKNKKERKLEGYENLKYFHHKFNTFETKVFYERYLQGSHELKNLNETVLMLSNQESRVY